MTVVAEFLRRVYKLLWACALLVLVLLALYASLGRQYIGLVARYQHEIMDYVQNMTEIPLSVSQLTGNWSGLSPIISAADLTIAGGAIVLDRVTVELDPVSSLLGVGPRLSQLRLGRLELYLEQNAEGRWSLPGLSAGSDEVGIDPLIDLVLAVRRADMDELYLNLRFADGRKTSARIEDFSWVGDGFFRRSYGRISTDGGGDIRFLGEARGDPRDEEFSANTYAVVDQASMTSLAPLFEHEGLANSEASGEIWFRWREGRRLSLRGILRAPELAAGVAWGSNDVFNDVEMRFSGSHHRGVWQLAFSEFSALWRDQHIDLSGLSMDHPDRHRWRFALPQLDLHASAELLTNAGVLHPELQNTLKVVGAKGELRHARVVVDTREEVAFSLQSELQALSLEPWHGAPGVSGLSGFIDVQRDGGKLLIDSSEMSLHFPNVYHEAFALSDVRGELRWGIADQRLRLYSGPITLRNSDARHSALLRLSLPLEKDAEVPPQMTLAVAVEDLDLGEGQKFIPYFLSDGLRSWIADSVKSGRADRADFIYHGALEGGGANSRSVQLKLAVSDLNLRFQPDWPAIQAGKATLLLDNGEVLASGEDVSISGIAASDVAVLISEESGQSTLKVSAKASPTFAAVQRLFRQSPLGELSGQAIDSWRGEGRIATRFDLEMPLEGEPLPQVNVVADVNLPLLLFPELNLSLTEVDGRVHYQTESGLNSESLSAKLFGEPIRAILHQSGSAVSVDAQGFVNMRDVQRWLDQPALTFFDGRTAVRLELAAGGQNPGVKVTSNMVGVGIQLPQPIYKAASEPMPLVLNYRFADVDPPLTMSLGDEFRLRARLGGDRPAIALSVGKSSSATLRDNAVSIVGALDFATTDQWLPTLTRFTSQAGKHGGTSSMPIVVEGIRIAEADVMGLPLNDLRLQAQSSDNGWSINLAADELAGDVFFPLAEGEPIAGYFARINLADLPKSEPGAPAPLSEVDPSSLPAVDFDVDKLTIGARNYGRLGFNLRSDEQGAHFLSLRGQVMGVVLDSGTQENSLHWWRDTTGVMRSQLRGRFGVKDIGDTLRSLGYEKVMETRSGTIDMNIGWLGSPDAWTMAKSQGRVGFHFKDGRFLKSSDAASGTLRVLSVFNMTNLVRRLKFDFRDVFGKGIHFDDVSGELGFATGSMHLTSPLNVVGPSSRFQMTGNIDLISEQLDMRLVATLPVGSNLPWMAALVGGLPAAAGAYVVTKVFEEQVDSFSSAVYDLSGSVQDPQLSFRKIFDVESDRVK